MKKRILRHNRTAAIALLVTVFLVACSKNEDVAYHPNPVQQQQKIVIAYNKHSGDSMTYDNKGRVIEQWVGQTFRTYYEYPAADEVIVKVMDLSINKMASQFFITIENGHATKLNGKRYDQNGVLIKNFGSQFEYNAGGYLTKITNDNGNNADIIFTYNGDMVTEIKRGYDHALLEYDMTAKLPVFVPNLVYGLAYDNFFELSGLFYNGMMGNTSSFAVKKITKPNIWQSPVEFNNTYSETGELLATKLALWESMYMGMEMTLRYKTITVQP